MRAAEDPLRTDLDAKGLKAKVLGRIEEVEKRERQELLSHVMTVVDEHRLDAGAFKAVLSG